MRTKSNKSGFTLVEMLLYITILGTMSFLILGFVNNVLQVKYKQQTISEVERQGLFISEHLKRNIEAANDIILPAEGATANSLVASLSSGEKTFSLESGVLNVTQNGVVTPLNNTRVQISSFNCVNLSQGQIRNVVNCIFDVSALDTYNRFEYSYSKLFSIISAQKN